MGIFIGLWKVLHVSIGSSEVFILLEVLHIGSKLVPMTQECT